MRKNWMARGSGLLAGLIGGGLLGAGFAAGAGESGRGVGFGFTGPEIFPIENQIAQLRSADLDGDGRLDLIVANNLRSKISLLYNRTGDDAEKRLVSLREYEVNELPPDARFRLDAIASEKRIASLDVTDLNGDGKPDLAYFGEPKELVVQYNQGTNGWSLPKRWSAEDAQLTPNGLIHGDLNHDGRTDLVLLGDGVHYVFYQDPAGQLGDPVRIPFSDPVRAIQILDVNGDKREDLLMINWDSEVPFRIRFQNDDGQLGSEVYVSLPSIRSYWADDLDGDRRPEVITISQRSGRAQLSHFVRKPAEVLAGSLKEGQFQVLPFNKSGQIARGLAWADVNDDGRTDLLVAEPDSGQLSLYLQLDNGDFAVARSFPSFTGIAGIEVADWDGDGTEDIFLLSSDEGQVGVTRLTAMGRIPFPDMLPIGRRPLAIAAGRMKADENPVLAVIVDAEGRRELEIRRAEGKPVIQKLDEKFRSNPRVLVWHDVDQDGLQDLVALLPYEKVKIMRQIEGEEAAFEELDIAPPGGSVEQPWLSLVDVDGDRKPELLLAQKNFVRAVVLRRASESADAGWTFEVKEQINGTSSRSRIVGAAAILEAKEEVPTLFLLDAEMKVLTVCRRDKAGAWQTIKNARLPYAEFNALHPIALDSKTPNSIAFTGPRAAGWIAFAGDLWTLDRRDRYETPVPDGYLMDVVSGDLNRDGLKDLLFIEGAKHHLDVVQFEKPGRLVPGNRWKVFEERTFRNRRGGTPEPREAVIADFTGDGQNDIAIVVHDRILLYPQEE